MDSTPIFPQPSAIIVWMSACFLRVFSPHQMVWFGRKNEQPIWVFPLGE